MIELSLRRHPATPAPAVRAVRVSVQSQPGGGLSLIYAIDAPAGSVLLAPPAAAQRRDELWRHSCFELFAAAEGDAYREFNFAPCGAWAVYDFSGYRSGRADVNTGTPPAIQRDASGSSFSVSVDAGLLLALRHGPAALALSAVIEDADAQLSYWALRHPPGKPDFHHRHGFAIGWPLAPGAKEQAS
jgi:hypothetical protein